MFLDSSPSSSLGVFDDEGRGAKLRVIEEPAKPFLSNIAVSDMFVPVRVGPKWSFGIVGVDHLDVIDAENAVKVGDCFLDSRRGRDVEARSVARSANAMLPGPRITAGPNATIPQPRHATAAGVSIAPRLAG